MLPLQRLKLDGRQAQASTGACNQGSLPFVFNCGLTVRCLVVVAAVGCCA